MMVASHSSSWCGGGFWKTSPPSSTSRFRRGALVAQVAKPVGCRGGSVYSRGGDRSRLKLDRREGTSSTDLALSNANKLFVEERRDDISGRPRSLIWRLPTWTFPAGVSIQEKRGREERGEGCQEQDFQDGVAVAGSGLGSHGPGLRADYRQGAGGFGSYSRSAQPRMHRRRTPSRRQFRHCLDIST